MSVKVITYDVGTTGMKACMFDISAEESVRYIDGETDGYPLHVLKNGGVEQDPDDWWQSMARATKKLLAKTGVPKEEIKGISFCFQFQTVVMVDENGTPLHRGMSCMDSRADKQFKQYMATGVKVEGLDVVKVLKYLKITGAVSASAKDPAWKYLWIKENEPETFEKTYKWLDAKEYLTRRATGNMIAGIDDAGGTFLYDVHNKCWSKTLCKMLDIDMKHLPDLCESTDEVGKLLPKAAEELGLAPGISVISGGSAISPFICQVMADVLGRDVETIENPRQVGAMGAAALMAVSFGMLDDIKDIKQIIKVDKLYKPNMENHAVYKKLLPVFKDLYKNNKKAFAALNG